MLLSESFERSVHEIIDLTARVQAALKAGETGALAELAGENRRIRAALEAQEPANDPNALDVLLKARERMVETRAALESKRAALAEELRALDVRKKIDKAYTSPG